MKLHEKRRTHQHVVLLLQLLEDLDHAAEKDDGGLKATDDDGAFHPPTDAKQQIQRVVEGVHGKVLAVKVLVDEANAPDGTTIRLQARSMYPAVTLMFVFSITCATFTRHSAALSMLFPSL